jgi:hypothetical protein
MSIETTYDITIFRFQNLILMTDKNNAVFASYTEVTVNFTCNFSDCIVYAIYGRWVQKFNLMLALETRIISNIKEAQELFLFFY